MVIEEHARLKILLPSESQWRNISENDVINGSLSILSKCMDDDSFSLGGTYSAQLSAKIRLQNTNAYKITGAKIEVYSWYSGQDEFLRGIFWITSVSRKDDIYTISASDSLIWLDSVSYDDSGNGKNIIYDKLLSDIGNIGYKFNQIIESVNTLLDNEKKLSFYDDTNIVNYLPSGNGYCVLPADMVGKISSTNPRDYASWIAEIACGFIYTDYIDGIAKIRIGQFEEEISDEISVEETEFSSCEIADFALNFIRVYTDIYDGSSGSVYNDSESGITVNISDNPFKDGHWQYNNGNAMDLLNNIYEKLCGNYKNMHGLPFRPFKIKCHCKRNFHLGQKIGLPDSNVSWITSINWRFRGGYTLGCAGKDTRTLYSSSKRSQATKIKDLAYTKVNTEIAKLKKEFSNESSKNFNIIQNQIEQLWDAVNSGTSDMTHLYGLASANLAGKNYGISGKLIIINTEGK